MLEPKIYYINVESSDWKINPNIPLHVKRKKFYTKEQIFYAEATRSIDSVNRLGDHNKIPRYFRAIQNYNSSWDRSFFDVSIEIAEKLWALNKPVKVAWSGGIDSMVAAVAMLLTKPDSASLNFIYTNHSINEYPLFYEKYIKNYNEPVEKEEIFSLLNSYTDSIIVTGEVGDQTFGFDRFMYFKDILEYSQPWENVFNWAKEKWEEHELVRISWFGTKKERAEMLYKLMEKCPVSNPTIGDFFWWMSFVNKYD